MKYKQLNLFFTIDYKYIQHFTVTLTSILENNKDLEIVPYVITDLKPVALERVNNFFSQKYGIKLTILTLASSIFESFKITDHVSKATYFRLLIADIIPAHVNEGLFIDSDIVVTGQLDYFTSLEFNDRIALFAVDDGITTDSLRLKGLGFPAENYFNAGVMFLNLKLWRERFVSSKLVEIAEKFKNDLLWWDQDVLNMFFYKNWSPVPSRFNTFGIQKELKHIPEVVHYTGTSKPWDYNNVHPYRKLYFKYLKLTPYKFYNPLYFAIKRKLVKLLNQVTG